MTKMTGVMELYRYPELKWKGGDVVLPEDTHRNLVEWIERGTLNWNDFLEAVLSNDLKTAVHTADSENLSMIPHIVGWLYNYAPSACHGSSRKVKEWQERGGLLGPAGIGHPG